MRIQLFGVFGEDITLSSVESQLNEIEYYLGDPLDIEIDSVGGDVFEGYKIGSLLRSLPNRTTAKIKGDCASIATYVACSCQSILLNKNNQSEYLFMIHNPMVGNFQGNIHDMSKLTNELDRIKQELILAYTFKSNLNEKQLSQLMNNETLFTKDEAISSGFIDGFYEDVEREKIENVKVINYINLANMEKNEQKGDTILEKVNSMLNKLTGFEEKFNKKFVNYVDTTSSGQQIFVDAESVAESEGAKAYLADGGESTGEGLPDGSYQLQSGFEITVEGGLITAINELDMESKAKDEEIEALKQELANKANELETIKNSMESYEAKYTELENKLGESLKKTITAQAKPAPKAEDKKKESKNNIGGVFIDQLIAKNKKQLNIN